MNLKGNMTYNIGLGNYKWQC